MDPEATELQSVSREGVRRALNGSSDDCAPEQKQTA